MNRQGSPAGWLRSDVQLNLPAAHSLRISRRRSGVAEQPQHAALPELQSFLEAVKARWIVLHRNAPHPCGCLRRFALEHDADVVGGIAAADRGILAADLQHSLDHDVPNVKVYRLSLKVGVAHAHRTVRIDRYPAVIVQGIVDVDAAAFVFGANDDIPVGVASALRQLGQRSLAIRCACPCSEKGRRWRAMRRRR